MFPESASATVQVHIVRILLYSVLTSDGHFMEQRSRRKDLVIHVISFIFDFTVVATPGLAIPVPTITIQRLITI